ncbi:MULTISPECIES: flavin reductase family protein [unclassified Pseudoclavibacter]|uniref:flavin reductase family protein n=1 Tax=unclassified Pseudoclavibacter TaxID=2615177 RepID=UPI0013011F72|nr:MULTISPECIES: flavin reductase family protein [unclassified Pseudoclavibacter]KAB1644496.1 flavin reductase family protein [Pseudoclavibacter sp. CFCC 14310]KAB1664000.1 flavin reductase family protein [Pseudoclavibacter sp. CFCC 13611]
MSTTAALDPTTLRTLFGAFPSGIVLLGVDRGDERHGLVASSFTVGVSLKPPLVSVAVQADSQTWPYLRAAHHIGISYLGEQHSERLRQLAGSDRAHRFDGIATTSTEAGALLLTDAPVALECSLHSEVEAGDHNVAFLEVLSAWQTPEHTPLLWHRSQSRSLL